MDALATGAGDQSRAIKFHGRWQEFLPIAITNLLLTLVTLGIYRFWAKARARRYLWSNTQIIDDPIEWTGTGGEMFIGFLIVMGGLFLVYLIAIGLFVATVAFHAPVLAIPLFALLYVGLIWFLGFAQFRALRYRLSRTWWRGIRGGSDDKGVSYANGAFGRTLLAAITGGILFPHALVENWNNRWNAMSFGPDRFESSCDTDGLTKRWLFVYGALAMSGVLLLAMRSTLGENSFALIPVFYIAVGLATMAFWALFFRKAAESLTIGGLSMAFPVSTRDWLMFYLKVAGLTIVTLGFGAMMWGFWRWQFVTDRLGRFGEVDVDARTQSTTAAPRDAEGFADAFDVGAF